MKHACPRTFEVEAARDGRLAGDALANFERHVLVCAACRRESKALEDLAASLREDLGGEAVADELQVRRTRTRLLASFDRALVGSPGVPRETRGWLVPASVAGLVVLLAVAWGARRPGAAPAGAIVRAGDLAVWTARKSLTREEIVLDRGILWIHVEHRSGERGLLVVLPDGELEDVGTTFSVGAEGGHTTRVEVEEGRVVLRLRGRPAVPLGPGEAWVADEPPAASAGPQVTAAQAPSAPSALTMVERLAPRAVASADPLAEFRAAMAALDAGDDRAAAARFGAFIAAHPRDARAEDAAYLRAIALQRSGDAVGARDAAVEYLRLFPSGFRRSEAQRMAGSRE